MDAQTSGCLSSAVHLQLMRVQTAQGRYLGRVFDLRTRWTPGSSEPLVVQALLVGRAGWMQRVGLRPWRLHELPWSAVRASRNGVLVVDDVAAGRLTSADAHRP